MKSSLFYPLLSFILLWAAPFVFGFSGEKEALGMETPALSPLDEGGFFFLEDKQEAASLRDVNPAAEDKKDTPLMQSGSSSDRWSKVEPFLTALAQEDTRCIEYLLKLEPSLVYLRRASTPLHGLALDLGNKDQDGRNFRESIKHYLEEFEALDPHYGPQNCVDGFGNSPLHLAAYVGNGGVAEALLRAGFSPKQPNAKGETPLHLAAYNGYSELVKSFLERGVHVNAVTKNGDTALHLAAQNGHAEVLKVLIAQQADPGIANAKGQTPLYKAASSSFVEPKAFQALFSEDSLAVSCLNQKDRRGEPLLITAIRAQVYNPHAFKNARYLVEQGACVNTSDALGASPLHAVLEVAPFTQETLTFIEFLLEKGADANAQRQDGATPLHLGVAGACVKRSEGRAGSLCPGALTILDTLVAHKAKIDLITKAGETPLDWARASQCPELIDWLLHNGAYGPMSLPKE